MAFSNVCHSKSIYSYCWSKIVDFSCLTTKKSKGWPGWQWYPHNCWWLPFPFGRILLEHTATVKSCASLVQWKQCLDILQQLKEEEQCLENLWLLRMGRNRLTYVLRMLLAQSGQKKTWLVPSYRDPGPPVHSIYFGVTHLFSLPSYVRPFIGQLPGMVLKPCKWWDNLPTSAGDRRIFLHHQ